MRRYQHLRSIQPPHSLYKHSRYFTTQQPSSNVSLQKGKQTPTESVASAKVWNKYHGLGLTSQVREAQDKRRKRNANALTNRMGNFMVDLLVRHDDKTLVQKRAQQLYCMIDQSTPDILNLFYGEDRCQMPSNFQSWFSITQLHLWMLQSRFISDQAQQKIETSDGRVITPKMNRLINSALIDNLMADIGLKLQLEGVTQSKIYDRYTQELMSSHYGCVLAYDEGFEKSDAFLAAALWRNMYLLRDDDTVGMKHLALMTEYVRKQMAHIHSFKIEDFYHAENVNAFLTTP
ncbi:hypothetical protein MIR68_011561 [Amoeboaphelidium protococcarum]|nr:hypothetical protein MIR68_011561 [Amoeboaphelidium protococcarum]